MNDDVTAEVEKMLVEQEGIAIVKVSDGQLIILTADMLARLLIKANADESGLIIVFVKRADAPLAGANAC